MRHKQKKNIQIQNSDAFNNHLHAFLAQHHLTAEELVNRIQAGQDTIPLHIFSGQLAPLEALVKYLREQRGWKNRQIAQALNRSQKTVWQAYEKHGRQTPLPSLEAEGPSIPLANLAKTRLSILETVVQHQLQQGWGIKEIACLLNKDPRTVSTVKARIQRKHGRA